MDIVDEHGLSVGLITPAELAARPWLGSGRPIDVVRMPEPPAGSSHELAAAGFVRKPELLCWKAELGSDEAEFLARLENKSRQDIRRARARAESALRLSVHDRLVPEILDPFLTLYQDRVAEMAYGIPIAVRQRERLLGGAEKYFAVFAHEGDELVGGCVVRECPDEDAVRIRFSAVTEQWRRHSLARTLYFAAMRTAREKGYRWATLGDEPNLYGHLTKAGLFSFKVNMGFRCVPSQDFNDIEGRDLADLVLSLTNLSGPCLMLGYAADPAEDRTLRAELFTDDPAGTDPRKYTAPFLAGIEVRTPVRPDARTVGR
ncbi:GNAT family N-acetyltransferase [Streptomyces sp. NPDC058297]|uniref:GNAT family N-acetyltransferase n=1 Tax=Streptomyces sp. NPDC058297 TaxID=3346433 RepID=UPI0036F168FF